MSVVRQIHDWIHLRNVFAARYLVPRRSARYVMRSIRNREVVERKQRANGRIYAFS